MVVHLEHADAACGAMVRPHWLPRVYALSAHYSLRVIALERRLHALGDLARVRAGRSQVSHIREQAEPVENDAVYQPFLVQGYPLGQLVLDIPLPVPEVDVQHIPQNLRYGNQCQSLSDYPDLATLQC